MHEIGCLGLVHWDDPEGWDGERGGRGNLEWGTHVHLWRIHVNVRKANTTLLSNSPPVKINKFTLKNQITTKNKRKKTIHIYLQFNHYTLNISVDLPECCSQDISQDRQMSTLKLSHEAVGVIHLFMEYCLEIPSVP